MPHWDWLIGRATRYALVRAMCETYIQQMSAVEEIHSMATKISKTEAEWRKQLTPEQYSVLRQKATERPFSGKYVHDKAEGTYHCAACGQPLFASGTKGS